jgi:hypothetical protein
MAQQGDCTKYRLSIPCAYTTTPRRALRPNQGPHLQELKRPGRKADNSSLYSSEIRNQWSYTLSSPCTLVSYKQFYFYFHLITIRIFKTQGSRN